ncbi:MAG: hypothetical protein WC554_07945 [Clostridia bacterium]|jgi:hypothetical protein
MARQIKDVWSRLVKNPQFSNTQGMMDCIKTLPVAEMVIPKSPEGIDLVDYRLTRNKDTLAPYGIVSSAYGLLQHYEVAVPMLDAVEEHGLTPYGGFREPMPGRMVASSFFKEESMMREVRVGDVVAFGFEWFNGQDGMMGYGLKGMAMRLRCTNGMTSTEFLGAFREVHFKNHTEGVKRFAGAIENIMKGIPSYEKAVASAAETRIPFAELRPLLVGAGLSIRMADDVGSELPGLVPDVSFSVDSPPTAWDIHNSLTSFGSHQDRTYSGFNHISSVANKLLIVDDFPRYVEAGKEVILIEEQKKKK